MRIVGGTLRGKKLLTPQSQSVRPTSDRLRETIFNILAHNPEMGRILNPQTRALDAFAGSGALGIEALSRGVGHVTFADINSDLVTQNIKLCNLEDRSRVLKGDASNLSYKSQFDLVFLDPPYNKGLINKTLQNLLDQNAISENAIIIAEFQKDEEIQRHKKMEFLTERVASNSKILFLRCEILDVSKIK